MLTQLDSGDDPTTEDCIDASACAPEAPESSFAGVARAMLDAIPTAAVCIVGERVVHANSAAEVMLAGAATRVTGGLLDALWSSPPAGRVRLVPFAPTDVTLASGARVVAELRALRGDAAFPAGAAIITLRDRDARLATEDETASQRMIRLQAVTSLLSSALSEAEVAEVVVRYAVEATGSDTGGVFYAVSKNPGWLDLIAFHGTPDLKRRGLSHLAFDSPTPAAFAARTRRSVWVETAADYERLYPALAALLRPATRARAMCVIPLIAFDRLLGVLGMGFSVEHPFTSSDRAFIVTLAEQCAQALDRSRAYEKERAARAEAERARRAREELLAIVAHDLKNPLGAIVLAASSLEKRAAPGELGEATRRTSQHILQAADRMERLTRDLLDAASIEAGRLSLSPRAGVDLAVLVDEAIAMQAAYADEKAVSVERIVLGSALAVGDRDRIAQVLANLTSNAVKFTPAGGAVTITVEPSGDDVAIRVADSGPGIAPEQVARLFDRFERGTHDRSETGLGLYIAKGIVEAHGAVLGVATEMGKGTVFSFTLRRG